MILFEEAYAIVMERARPLEVEQVDIRHSFGRVLAEDVASDIDMPPFDKSAMDGYACRRADLAGELVVIETIPAGSMPTKVIGPGQCSKIMTGAMVPEGADCVIMVEQTECPAEGSVHFIGKDMSRNICSKGEDIRTGDVVLHKGTRIAPQHIAVLATVGCVQPRVYRQPRVGVIATGDELVEPDVKPGPCQIRTTNSYQVCAQIEAAGAVPTYYGIARDTEEAIDEAFKRAMTENDVGILSGGVSMGDFDLVPGIMTANGIEILFDSVAIKPGKPTTFGISPEKYCFGLPGNPVSTFIIFEILIRPFLCALMGLAFRPVEVTLPLDQAYRRKRADREFWLPVKTTGDGRVRLTEFHGSAHINSLCFADGLITVPVEVTELAEGTPVRVRLLQTIGG